MNGRKGFSLGLKAAAAGLLAIGVAVLAFSQASAQDPAVSIERSTVAFGETGTVDLSSLDIDSPGLGAWEIGIGYDPSVATPTDCEELAGSVCNIAFSPNQIRVTGASASGHEGDEVLARVSFSCNSDSGTTSLSLTVSIFSDATVGNPQPISADVEHGSISCVEAGNPIATATRRPTDEPDATDEPDEPDETDEPSAADATATPSDGGATVLPEVGSGGGSGSDVIAWLAGGLATAGLAGIGALGVLRRRSRIAA